MDKNENVEKKELDKKCDCGIECKCKKNKSKIIIFSILGALLLIGLILCIYFFVIKDDEKTNDNKDNNINEEKVDNEENKEEPTDEENDDVVEEEDSDDYYVEEEYEDESDNCDGEDDYVSGPVNIHGLEGNFSFSDDVVIAHFEDNFLSYDINSDGIKEEFSVKADVDNDEEDNMCAYNVSYTHYDNKGNPVGNVTYLDISCDYSLTAIDVVDLIEGDGKYDVILNFFSDVTGMTYWFDYTNLKLVEWDSELIYINGSGKVVTPIYYTTHFDLLLATDYYVVGTDGKVTKNKIDLSNINKEVTIPCGEPDFSYCTSSGECDNTEWKEFPGGAKIKLISYSKQNGLIAEYNGQKVYVIAPWG